MVILILNWLLNSLKKKNKQGLFTPCPLQVMLASQVKLGSRTAASTHWNSQQVYRETNDVNKAGHAFQNIFHQLLRAYLSFITRTARFNVARIKHICAKVEVGVNAARSLNYFNTDLCTRWLVRNIHIALHLSTHRITETQVRSSELNT